MEIRGLDIGRKTMSPSGRIITREEYDALMSELALESEPEHVAPISETDDKVRKLEFNMMVLVGLILVVFILCRTN
jgi:hypothetical protein